jgi:hypothetical protein
MNRYSSGDTFTTTIADSYVSGARAATDEVKIVESR